MSEVKFSCPHCRQRVVCDDAYCGERILCPGCQREMLVPKWALFVSPQTENPAPKPPVGPPAESPSSSTIPSGLNVEQWAGFAAANPATASSGTGAINWLIFFTVLLAPAMLALVGMAAGSVGVVLLASFIGSGCAGLTCARMLAGRLSSDRGTRALLAVVFSLTFAALSFALCFVGCAAGIPLASRGL